MRLDQDDQILLWKAMPERALFRHEGVDALVFAPDGKSLFCAGGDGLCRWWLDGRRELLLESALRTIAIAPDGRWLLGGGYDGELVRVDFGSGERPFGKPFEYGVGSIAISPDGKQVVIVGDDDRIELRDANGEPLWQESSSKFPYVTGFSGTRFFVGTWAGQLYVYNGNPPRELEPTAEWAGGCIFDAEFLPDGRVVVVGANSSTEGLVRIGDHVVKSTSGVHAVAVVGNAVAVAGNDQEIRLLQLPWLELVGRMSTQRPGEGGGYFPSYAEFYPASGPGAVRTLAASPDKKLLAYGCENGDVALVSVEELAQAGTAPPPLDLLGIKRRMNQFEQKLDQLIPGAQKILRRSDLDEEQKADRLQEAYEATLTPERMMELALAQVRATLDQILPPDRPRKRKAAKTAAPKKKPAKKKPTRKTAPKKPRPR
jgi:WD40 repeat protein